MFDKANKNEEESNKVTQDKIARFHGSDGMKEVGKAILPY
jgi:hypothetical protein